MFNQKSIVKVDSSKFNAYFQKPVDDYNLVNIPGTILNLFGKKNGRILPKDVFGPYYKTYDKVVLIVLDAFGYAFFEKNYKKSSFLQKVVKNGVVSKLTTQFPSTTTANVTTLHSGLPVTQSGVIEWFYFEPEIDTVYSPLLYKKAREAKLDKVLSVLPNRVLPQAIYQQFDIASYVFQYHLYNQGPYSNYMQQGATSVDFNDFEDGLNQLKKVLQKDEKSYSYFYHSDLDTISHEYGPEAKETKACLLSIFKSIDTFFDDVEKMNLKNTLFMITADHGHTTVVKENTIYINLSFPEILPHLKRNQKGELIVPCGSLRDMFLHIKQDKIDFVLHFLQEKLKRKADVYKVETLLNEGIFGKEKVSQRFLDRIGDIVILAYPDQAIWWYEEDLFHVKHLGMHGGLVKAELEIPFLVYSL